VVAVDACFMTTRQAYFAREPEARRLLGDRA